MLPTDTLERLGDAFALTAPAERKRMLVIVNPHATTVSDGLRNLVVSALQGRYDVQAIDTAAKEHATQLAREAAGEGFDLVVAFGGDGTLNEVANGLVGSATPLTTLPGGSANVFGKMLGIPGDIVDATEHLLRVVDDFRPRQVDLARVNDRWFTFSAGMGLDAAVVARVDAHPRLKARYGPKYFSDGRAGGAGLPRRPRGRRALGRRRADPAPGRRRLHRRRHRGALHACGGQAHRRGVALLVPTK